MVPFVQLSSRSTIEVLLPKSLSRTPTSVPLLVTSLPHSGVLSPSTFQLISMSLKKFQNCSLRLLSHPTQVQKLWTFFLRKKIFEFCSKARCLNTHPVLTVKFKSVSGILLVKKRDETRTEQNVKFVSKRQPIEDEIYRLLFA